MRIRNFLCDLTHASGGEEEMRKKIIMTIGNSAVVMVRHEFLAQMGVQVGDEVELRMKDRTLVARSVEQGARDGRCCSAFEVFRRRRSALKRLAE
jgi:antitoxin component of MazEF toxin-antitoxin module